MPTIKNPCLPYLPGFLLLLLAGLLAPSPGGAWVWTHADIDNSGADLGQYVSMTIDGNGRIHVAYRRFTSTSEGDRNPIYATNPLPFGAGSWSRQVADPEAQTGAFCSIATDYDGRPYIAYYESELGDLRCAWYDSSRAQWRVEVVDQTGVVGQYTSIAAAGGLVWIAYYDASTPALKFATRNFDGTWTREVVDSTAAVGLYADLDTGLGIQIAYFDLTHTALKLARQVGLAWQVTTIDSFGDVGRFPSIHASLAGTFISYDDKGQGTLKLAEQPLGGSTWTITTVDASGDVGQETSLATDIHGRPHVVYHREGARDLRYAGRYGSGWVYNVVESAGDVGRFNAIAIDREGFPNVAYYDATQGIPRYAFGVGTTTGEPGPAPNATPPVRLVAAVNPVRGPAPLRLSLDAESPVTVRIFDARGRLVRTLVDGPLAGGEHRLLWNGDDDAGRPVGPGVYFSLAQGPADRALARIVRLR